MGTVIECTASGHCGTRATNYPLLKHPLFLQYALQKTGSNELCLSLKSKRRRLTISLERAAVQSRRKGKGCNDVQGVVCTFHFCFSLFLFGRRRRPLSLRCFDASSLCFTGGALSGFSRAISNAWSYAESCNYVTQFIGVTVGYCLKYAIFNTFRCSSHFSIDLHSFWRGSMKESLRMFKESQKS